MRTIAAAAGTVALTTALVGALALPAVAKDGDVVRRGDCSRVADWKLKVGPEDGRLEVEGEVDSNRSGQRWTWLIRHNGKVVASGARHTAGRSGSFDVRRIVADASGPDRIAFRAVRPATGQVCRGSITF